MLSVSIVPYKHFALRDPCAYNISTSKLFISLVEKVAQIIPDHDIRLNKNGFRLRGVLVHQFLRFRTECKVTDNDIAIAREQQFRKAEVYAFVLSVLEMEECQEKPTGASAGYDRSLSLDFERH
jgi:hypothetical protein